MSDLIRFGTSIEEPLLNSFDKLIEHKGYMTRSEAIRDLIRATLIDDRIGNDAASVAATVTLVYNHHATDLAEKLTEYQHAHGNRIISSLHVHLNVHNCLEVLVMRGTAREIKQIGDKLIGIKGVKHGKLVITTTEEGLHEHGDGLNNHQH